VSVRFLGPAGESCAIAPAVPTTSGAVQGLEIDGIARYLGIRYGEAPTGDRRFRAPVTAAPRDGVQDATGFGAPAVQDVSGDAPVSALGFALRSTAPTGSYRKIQSEDCLHLNVWTPGADDARRPVLVWLHGGGFATGSGADPIIDGARFSRRGDVVVVTLNHRLHLFGFLAVDEVVAGYDGEANPGIRDIVLALEWVRDNIAVFGGDPEQITIGGQSGGGGKVSHLMGMPSAKGLFHRAIVMSGPGLTAMAEEPIVDFTADVLARVAGGDRLDAARLAGLPAEALHVAARSAAVAASGPRNPRFRTILQMGADLAARLRTRVDGTILPAHPFEPEAAPTAAEIPLLTGWVKDEWTWMLATTDPEFVHLDEAQLVAGAAGMYDGRGPEILELLRAEFPHYAPGHLLSQLSGIEIGYRTTQLAARKSRQPAPVYAYQLQWETPVADGLLRTPHCLDLPLALDNVDRARALVGDDADAQRMADLMADAWVAFVRTGSPQTSALPTWDAYDAERRPTMCFDLEPRMLNAPLEEVHRLIAAN